MKMTTLFLFYFCLTQAVYAEIKTDALSYVPNGSIKQLKLKEVKIQTAKGSIIEVEFHRNGAFEEASGDTVLLDEFIPPKELNLIPLSEAVKALESVGKKATGEWSLEESFLRGWHYEFDGFENSHKMDYILDAKTGKLVDEKIDD